MSRRGNNLSPGAPLPSLMRSLRRSGWGELSGREWQGVRSVLEALVAHAHDGSGRAEVTAWQIATSAGLSERWTRRCLHVLEDLGVITWHRGTVAYHQPQPSLFLVIKRRIVELIREARPIKDAAALARRAVTAKRLQRIRSGFAKSPPRRLPRSDRPELNASLRPKGEASTGTAPPGEVEQPTLLAAMTAAGLHTARKTAPPAPGPDDTGPANPIYERGAALARAQMRRLRPAGAPAHA